MPFKLAVTAYAASAAGGTTNDSKSNLPQLPDNPSNNNDDDLSGGSQGQRAGALALTSGVQIPICAVPGQPCILVVLPVPTSFSLPNFGAIFSTGNGSGSSPSDDSTSNAGNEATNAGGDGTRPNGATNAPVTSEGTANSATFQGLKNQLANQNLVNIAAQDPRLAAAVNGSGTTDLNFSFGSGTVAEANQLGKTWVGDGATMTSDGSGMISADGTRVYRFPTQKTSDKATTGIQANFETYSINAVTGARVKVSNGHLNVTN
jgi:hypothetical protein